MRETGDMPAADTLARAAAAPVAAKTLLYDRGGGTVSVRGFRLLVVLTLVNTALLASMVLGPQLSPFVRQQFQSWKDARAEKQRLRAELAAQQKCQNDSPPPSKVVYTEDPNEVIGLATASFGSYETVARGQSEAAPPGWVSPVRAVSPDYFGQFVDAASGRSARGGFGGSSRRATDQALLFLHERVDPSGRKFLIAVRMTYTTSFQRGRETSSDAAGEVTVKQMKQRWLVMDVWPLGPGGPSVDSRGNARQLSLLLSLPDHLNRPIAQLKPGASLETAPVIDYGNKLRFFAGQADATDPSHFTIAYDLDGRPGTIDGWLRSAGPELRPREGRVAYDSNGRETWDFGASVPP
jgi:hypothetical protein